MHKYENVWYKPVWQACVACCLARIDQAACHTGVSHTCMYHASSYWHTDSSADLQLFLTQAVIHCWQYPRLLFGKWLTDCLAPISPGMLLPLLLLCFDNTTHLLTAAICYPAVFSRHLPFPFRQTMLHEWRQAYKMDLQCWVPCNAAKLPWLICNHMPAWTRFAVRSPLYIWEQKH